MTAFGRPGDILDTLSAPVGDLIASVGRSLAEAQQALDAQAIESLREIYGDADGPHAELRKIGYRPPWYQIPEVSAEISVALTLGGTATEEVRTKGRPLAARSRGPKLYAAPVDAGYRNRFDYDLRAASVIKFRIVPVPPSARAAEMRVVPDLSGLTFAGARALLAEIDVPFVLAAGAERLADEARVRQSPEPGELIGPGEAVVLSEDRGT